MVSGRPLSAHVDKFNPSQGIVNLTYSTTDEVNLNKEIITQTLKDSASVIEETLIKNYSAEEIASGENNIINLIDNDDKEEIYVTNHVQVENSHDNKSVISSQNLQAQQINQNVQPGISSIQTQTQTNQVNIKTATISNPQLNLRMIPPQNLMGGQNFMMGYNPNFGVSGQMGQMAVTGQMNSITSMGHMSTIPQMANIPNQMQPGQFGNYGMQGVQNMNLIGQGNPQLQYNFPNVRQTINLGMQGGQNLHLPQQIPQNINMNRPQINPLQPGGQFNYGINPSLTGQVSQQFGGGMVGNQIGGAMPQNMTPINPPIQLNPPQNQNYELMRVSSQLSQLSQQSVISNESKSQTTNPQVKAQSPSSTVTPTTNNNLFNNLLQAINQLKTAKSDNPNLNNLLSQPELQQQIQNMKLLGNIVNINQAQNNVDKSKDPRTRKKK